MDEDRSSEEVRLQHAGDLFKRYVEDSDSSVLDELGGFSPDEVVRAILKHPPTVRYENREINPIIELVPPTEEELQYTEAEVPIPDDITDEKDREIFDAAVDYIKDYLRAPRIKDGLGDHENERIPWEEKVSKAVADIDRHKGNDPREPGSYMRIFRDAWATKFSRNKRAGVMQGVIALQIVLPPDHPAQPELIPLVERYNTVDLDSTEDIDKMADDISQIAIDVLRLFVDKG